MSGTNPDDLSQSPPSVGVDPQRLLDLLERAIELRNSGETDFVRTALDTLDQNERAAYEKPLTDRLRASGNETLLRPVRPKDGDNGAGKADAKTSQPVDEPTEFATSRRESEDDPESATVGEATPRLPEKIGKFRIERELGRGAFGVVYLAYDDELQRSVAVKLSLVADRKLQERLRVEASKLAQVESPGIVPVHHIGRTDDGKFYIVQKYIQGSSLRDIVTRKPLSPGMAVGVMREVALGLEPAHNLDILHRDLKPDNILIDENGKSWIADFGLAISEDEQVHHNRELAGTPPYMSPEQIQGRIDFMDPRSDIWSLGVMFYELLTGKLPFNGKDRKTLSEQICELDPRPLHQRAPGHLSESMNDVFLRCCAKKPADRFATVGQFVEALDQLVVEGLSDINIFGETTLRIEEFTSDADELDSRYGSSRRVTQRASTRGSRRTGTTKASRLTKMSTLLVAGGWKSFLIFWAVAAATGIGLMFVGVAAHHFYTSTGNQSGASGGTLSPTAEALDPATRGRAGSQIKRADGSKQWPWIVSPQGDGSHTTLAAAVAAASEGEFIRVMPGLYREPLHITTSVMIEGQPPKAGEYPCVIENDQVSPVIVDCPSGTATLRSLLISGKGHRVTKEFNPVEVTGGTLKLESCALETRSQNCIKVRHDAVLDVLACNFRDSADFAISAKDFSTITVTGSDFLCSGVEVTGGTGTIQSCKFYGDAGVAVANNLQGVAVRDCLLEGNSKYGLVATDGGNLIADGTTIRDSTLAVWATNQPMIEDAPRSGPGKVELKNTETEDCNVAIKVDGGILRASEDCRLEGGQIALGVSSGEVDLADLSISRFTENAIVVFDGGKVTLRGCAIADCSQSGIKLMTGQLAFVGGKIENFQQYGIIVGDKDSSGKVPQVTLENVEILGGQSKFAGIIAWRGRVELNAVTLRGAAYGVYADGPAAVGKRIGGPSVDLQAADTTFEDQSKFGLVARGHSRITMDGQTQNSLNESSGLSVVKPAEIVVDQREN